LNTKPYGFWLDAKIDANHGWVDELADRENLKLHINWIPDN
jgi:hypothetical protein